MTGMATADLTDRELSRFVKTAIAPRPIAWISTRSREGVDNLAPYSSYNYVGASPPVVVFNSPSVAAGGRKDTARNAIETGEFAVNVVTEPLLERMDRTSAPLGPDESEFDAADVELAPCAVIDADRVADAAVTMECTLHEAIEVHNRQVVFGDVVYVHVDESVLTDGQIDAGKLSLVGRLGGPYYTVARPVEYERQF